MVRPRRAAAEAVRALKADHVIVTTVPAHGTVVEQNPALRSLAGLGLLRADELGLGVKVDGLGQVVGAGGVGQATLLVVGPLAMAH